MKIIFKFTTLVLFFSLIVNGLAWGIELTAEDINTIRNYEGEYISVVGTVMSTHTAKSGKVRFLNLGPNYKTAFTAVIFTSDLNKFTSTIGEPTVYYMNKKVKIQGRIKMYKGKPEIILNTPEQITIIRE